MFSRSTRRRFIALSSATFVSALSPVRLLAQKASFRRGAPVFSNATLGAYQQHELTYARFESVVGSSFHAFLDDGVIIDLTLQKVTAADQIALPPSPITASARVRSVSALQFPPKEKCFVVQFSSGSTIVPQDSYVLDHGILGSFSVLLVPSPKGQHPATCTATFNYV